jgi:hypothetical protein
MFKADAGDFLVFRCAFDAERDYNVLEVRDAKEARHLVALLKEALEKFDE